MDQKELYNFLFKNVSELHKKHFGLNNALFTKHVVNAWLNDKGNSKQRYDEMYELLGKENVFKSRILDIASGCGTFVFFGLLNKIDVWGIEPEHWKNRFNHNKIDSFCYPKEWKSRFINSIGEDLPFPDNSFDIISSYQTLEHVQSLDRVLNEMVRVVQKGGTIFLRAPDYSGTFEGHYRLPWLPLFPKKLARIYLEILGRPTRGLDKIQYITKNKIKKILTQRPEELDFIDNCLINNTKNIITSKTRLDRLGKFGDLISLAGAYTINSLKYIIVDLFRYEKNINIIITKKNNVFKTTDNFRG